MPEVEFAALDAHQLLPRVLTDIGRPDTSTFLLDRSLAHPMVPRLKRAAALPGDGLALFEARTALDGANKHAPELTIALLAPDKMGILIAQVGQLAERGVAAVALDMTPLAYSPPYGDRPWRPRSREELAELRAAAGRPLWLLGLGGAADAEVAAEAGADGVIVGSELGARLGAPAVIEVLPEIIDAVGGMLTIAAGGPVRDGVDVLRYLAVGAELVLVDGERSLQSLVTELEYAMRLTGCAVLADVGYDALFAPLFGEA